MSKREMEELVAALERALGMQWTDIVEWLRDQNPVDAIEKRLTERGASGVILRVPDAAARFADALHDSYVQAGQSAMTWLDDRVPDALIRFDQTNYRAVSKAQTQRYDLIRGFNDEQRDVVRRVVSEGMRDGVNPRVQAKALRESIGLTDHQSRIVARYRRELQAGDWSAAMGRELHDGRSDQLLRRLRSEGGSLSQEQVDAMTERYRKNWVAYRAETIARTEALRAAHSGTAEAMQQAVERGDIERDELVQEWHAAKGPRTRDSHRVMDGQTRRMGEAFRSGNGYALRYPCDPNAPTSETANCRCAVSTVYLPPAAKPVDATIVADTPKKNPKRVAAAQKAAAASVERRREIHSAAKSNLPDELQTVWDNEGHKFIKEEGARIRGVKDPINAGSKISEAFAEKYGSGFESIHGNEGDRYYKRAEIEASHAETRFKELERKHYEEQRHAAGEDDEYARKLRAENDAWLNPPKVDDDEPPF